MMGVDVFQWFTGGKQQPPERKRKRRLPAISPPRARPVLIEPDVDTEPPAPVDEIVCETSKSFGSELTFIFESPANRRCSSTGKKEQYDNEKIENVRDANFDVEHILESVQHFLDGSHRFKSGEGDRLHRYLEETAVGDSNSLDLENFMELLAASKSAQSPLFAAAGSDDEQKSRCTILLDLDLEVDHSTTFEPVPERIRITQQQRIVEPVPEKIVIAQQQRNEAPKPENLNWPVEAPKPEEPDLPLTLTLPLQKILRPLEKPTPEDLLSREKKRPRPFPIGLIVPVSSSTDVSSMDSYGDATMPRKQDPQCDSSTSSLYTTAQTLDCVGVPLNDNEQEQPHDANLVQENTSNLNQGAEQQDDDFKSNSTGERCESSAVVRAKTSSHDADLHPLDGDPPDRIPHHVGGSVQDQVSSIQESEKSCVVCVQQTIRETDSCRSDSKSTKQRVLDHAKISSSMPMNPATRAKAKTAPLKSQVGKRSQPSPEKHNKTKPLSMLNSAQWTTLATATATAAYPTTIKKDPSGNYALALERRNEEAAKSPSDPYDSASSSPSIAKKKQTFDKTERKSSLEKKNISEKLDDSDSMQKTAASNNTGAKSRSRRSAPSSEIRKERAIAVPLVSDLDVKCKDQVNDLLKGGDSTSIAKKKQTVDEAEPKSAPEKKNILKKTVNSDSMQNTTVSNNTTAAKSHSRRSVPSSEIRKEKAIIVPSDPRDTYLVPDLDEKSKEIRTFNQVNDLFKGVCCPNTMPQQASLQDVSKMESESHILIPLHDLLCTNDNSRHLEPMAPSLHAPLVVEPAKGRDLGDPFPEKLRETHESSDPTVQSVERTLNLPVLIQLEATNPPLGESKRRSDRVSSEHVVEVYPGDNSRHSTVRSRHGNGGNIILPRDGDLVSAVNHETKRHEEPPLSQSDNPSRTKLVVQLANAMPHERRGAQMHEETSPSPASDRNQEEPAVGDAQCDESIKAREKVASRILRALDEDFLQERLSSYPQVRYVEGIIKAPDDSSSRFSIPTTLDDNNGNLSQDILSKVDTADNEEIEIVFVAESFQESEIFTKDGTQGRVFDSFRKEKPVPEATCILWWKPESRVDQIKYEGPVDGLLTLDDMVEVITCSDSSNSSLSSAQRCENSPLGRGVSHPDAVEVLPGERSRVEGTHHSIGARSLASTIQEVEPLSTAQRCVNSSLGGRKSLPDAVKVLSGEGRRAEVTHLSVVAMSVASTIQEVDSRSIAQRCELSRVGRRAEGTHRSLVASSVASTIQEVDSRSTAHRCDDSSIGARTSFPAVVELLLGAGKRTEGTHRSLVARSVASTIQEVDSRSTAQRCDDSAYGSRAIFPDTVEVRLDAETRARGNRRSIAARSVASTIQEVDSRSTAQRCDDSSYSSRKSFPDTVEVRPDVERRAEGNRHSVAARSVASTIQEVDSRSTAQRCDDFSRGSSKIFPDTVEVRPDAERRSEGTHHSIAARSIASTIQEVDSRSNAQRCDNSSYGSRTNFPDTVDVRPDAKRRSEGTPRSIADRSVASTIQEPGSCPTGTKTADDKPKNEQFRERGQERGQHKSLSVLRESVTLARQRLSALIPKRGLDSTKLEHDILSKTQLMSENSSVLMFQPTINVYQGSNLLESKDGAKAVDVEIINTSVRQQTVTKCDTSKNPNRVVETSPTDESDESVKHRPEHGHIDSIGSTSIDVVEGDIQEQDQPYNAGIWQMTMNNQASDGLKSGIKQDSTAACRQPQSEEEPREGLSPHRKSNSGSTQPRAEYDRVGVSTSIGKSAGAIDLLGAFHCKQEGSANVSCERGLSLTTSQRARQGTHFTEKKQKSRSGKRTRGVQSEETVANYDASVEQLAKHRPADSIGSTTAYGPERRTQKEDESSIAGAWRMIMNYRDTTSVPPLPVKEPLEGSHARAHDRVVSSEKFASIGKSASPDESYGDFDQSATLYSDTHGRVTFSLDAPTEASSELWESVCDEKSRQDHQSPYSDISQPFYSFEGEGRQVGGPGFFSELWRSISADESRFSTLRPRGESYERSPRGQLEVIFEKALGKSSTEETEPEVAVLHHGTEEVVELVYQEDLALCGSIDQEEVEIVFVEKSFMKRDGFSFGEGKGIVFDWLESEPIKQSRDKESGKGERQKKSEIISLVDLDRSKKRYPSSYQNEDFGPLSDVPISEKAASSYRKDIRRWLRDTKFDAPVERDPDLTLPTLRGQIALLESDPSLTLPTLRWQTALPPGNSEHEIPLDDERETWMHNATDLTSSIPNGQRDLDADLHEPLFHEQPAFKRLPNYAQDDTGVASVLSLCQSDECQILFTMNPREDKLIKERIEGSAPGKVVRSGWGVDLSPGGPTRIDTQDIGRVEQSLETQRMFSEEPSRRSDPPGSTPQRRDPHSTQESLKWKGPEGRLGILMPSSQDIPLDSRDAIDESSRGGSSESLLYRHSSQSAQRFPGSGSNRYQVEECQPISRRDLMLGQVKQVCTRLRYESSRFTEPVATDSRDEMNDSRKDGAMECSIYSHRSQSGKPFVGGELSWKQVEQSCRPPDEARRNEISSIDRRQVHAPPTTHPSRLASQRRVGAYLKPAREVSTDQKDESSLLSSSISENIESTFLKRARSNVQFSANRTGKYDEYHAYTEEESTGSSLTDFPESRGTQSTHDDFEGRGNEPESSSGGHDISSAESTEIVFFDEMETDEPETSLFGSNSSTYNSHAVEETHFPFSLSLDLRTKSTTQPIPPKLSLDLRSKTKPSPLPPQLSLDLRSTRSRQELTTTGLLPDLSAKEISKKQKGRTRELPPIDRSSSALQSGVGLSDAGDGERQRQRQHPLLSKASRRMLSRHRGSKSANGQERENPIDQTVSARSVVSEGRGKRNAESRSKSANGQERENPIDPTVSARSVVSEGSGKHKEESRLPELIPQIYYGPPS